jgi:hypothetical protein
VRQGTARRDAARQGEAWLGKARRGMAWSKWRVLQVRLLQHLLLGLAGRRMAGRGVA